MNERIPTTEAQRLTLYHLSSLFFHKESHHYRAEAEIFPDRVQVSLEKEGMRFCESVALDEVADSERSRSVNEALGLAFARCASHFTSYRPPYGTLIGVRPVKVPLYYLKKGWSPDEIQSFLEKKYWVSSQKASLLVSLAQKERDFEKNLKKEDCLLYLSIPFCPSRCSYCSFISSAAPKHLALIPEYLLQMEEEITETANLIRELGKRPRAIYIGGGTPGILTEKQMDRLLAHTRRVLGDFPLDEFCVEMGRPDTVTREKLAVLKDYGVDRISINPQTTNNETLSRIGRRHSAADFFRAMEDARAVGSFSINCDLIAALPGESPEIFLCSVRDVLSLSPENLTIHALCKKKSAAACSFDTEGKGFQKAMEEASKLCIKQNLLPYYLYRQKMAAEDLENLGYAKDGSVGFYNLAMMEDLTDVFACGAGAISKRIPRNGGRILRFAGNKYPFEYLSQPEKRKERLEQMKQTFCK